MKPLNPNQLPDWLKLAYFEIIQPKREIIQNHEFVQKMKLGEARKEDAKHYFAGLMWHLLDFGKHVSHLIQKRPDEVDHFLKDKIQKAHNCTDFRGFCDAKIGVVNSPMKQSKKREHTKHTKVTDPESRLPCHHSPRARGP